MQVTPHPQHLAGLAQQTPGGDLDAAGDDELMAEQQLLEEEMAAAAGQGYPLLPTTPLVTLKQNLQVCGWGALWQALGCVRCVAPNLLCLRNMLH